MALRAIINNEKMKRRNKSSQHEKWLLKQKKQKIGG